MERHARDPVDVTPSARRLTGSLRDIGYEFVAALADIVDNSVAAAAAKVEVEVVFNGGDSYVVIADDGTGMGEGQLCEALRFGSRRTYENGELGRYGLGLKTASISQCRRLTVATRRARTYRRLHVKSLDIDHIARTDRWEVVDPPIESAVHRSLEWLGGNPGTVVFWENLDRVLPEQRQEGGWARRRLEQLTEKARQYLGMVFHRFLEGDTDRGVPLVITVNGEKVRPWNPFAPREERRVVMPEHTFELAAGAEHGRVRLRRYVLPPRDAFSALSEFERLSGPLKWNRQQGIYVYRADRLIQSGGWCGIRAADEHTKFARASLDFQTDLDSLFRINVTKMRVSVPVEVRTLLERPVHELCHLADSVYRRDAQQEAADREPLRPELPPSPAGAATVGTALMAAALDAGEHEAFVRVMDRLTVLSPEVAAALGW